MKVWLICDDFYHPGDVVIEGFMPLKERGVEFTITKDTSSLDQGLFKNYDVIILAKNNTMSPDRQETWEREGFQQSLIEYVEQGGGLLTIHAGLTGKSDSNLPLYELIGSYFDHHPEQCPVTMKVVKDHPITAGVESYTLKDEHYHINITAADADILLETQSDHGTQPGGYVRLQGKGRICALTPGHNTENFLHPDFQKILYQSLRWCAGE